jgi:hypothetical protein
VAATGQPRPRRNQPDHISIGRAEEWSASWRYVSVITAETGPVSDTVRSSASRHEISNGDKSKLCLTPEQLMQYWMLWFSETAFHFDCASLQSEEGFRRSRGNGFFFRAANATQHVCFQRWSCLSQRPQIY